MEKLIILAVILLVLMVVTKLLLSGKEDEPSQKDCPIQGKYQTETLFTQPERIAFQKLHQYCKINGQHVLAKVRLFDLVKPAKNSGNYTTYKNKVQSKHIDFVICDCWLNVVALIELDDNSHKRPDRQARDTLVDEIVQSVGYKIIHCREINAEVVSQLR